MFLMNSYNSPNGQWEDLGQRDHPADRMCSFFQLDWFCIFFLKSVNCWVNSNIIKSQLLLILALK